MSNLGFAKSSFHQNKMAAPKVGKVAIETSAFFLVDIQEKFRHMIKYFPEICQVAQRLSMAAKLLDVPLIASEHYPKGLGKIVPEIDIDHASVFSKTSFSVHAVPEIQNHMKEVRPNLKSVILFGIEVSYVN